MELVVEDTISREVGEILTHFIVLLSLSSSHIFLFIFFVYLVKKSICIASVFAEQILW